MERLHLKGEEKKDGDYQSSWYMFSVGIGVLLDQKTMGKVGVYYLVADIGSTLETVLLDPNPWGVVRAIL